jgi:iron complex transport system ATP-binding protein
MIECKNMSFSFGKKPLIESVTWGFEEQQITAIVGPNGAGKSTLLKLILGIETPRIGEVSYMNLPLPQWDVQQLASIRAYMAQSSTARLGLPVFEYLTLARIHRMESHQQRDTHINDVIALLELQELATMPIDRLSGGEFQRVELARAWCQLTETDGVKDKLLILDEPSSALDINQTQRLYRNLRRFSDSGGTIIVVEHDINQAARFCDQMLMLKQGTLVSAGDITTTFTAQNINQCFSVNGRTLVDIETDTISFNL